MDTSKLIINKLGEEPREATPEELAEFRSRGEGIQVSAETLDKFLASLSYKYSSISVAQNEVLVAKNTRICSYCSAGYGIKPLPPNKLKVCGRCKNAYYCNRSCQVNHYSIHKHVCLDAKNQRDAAKMILNKK